MSRFSGKCDFCDEIEIFGLDHILNSDVYVGDSKQPLRLASLRDCVPYFPYVVSMAHHNQEKNRGYIRLTSKSWVDIEEERYGHFKTLDYYRERLEKELELAKSPDYGM